MRGNFRANFYELRIRFDLKNCEFAFDLVGIGIHNNAKVCETAFDFDKSGGDKGYLVIEILLGGWFVHGAQCYTGRALGVKYPMGLEPVVDTYSPVVRNLLLIPHGG